MRSSATLLRTSVSVEANSTVGMDDGGVEDVGVKDAETTRGGGDDAGVGVGVRPDEVATTNAVVFTLSSRASADQENDTEDDAVSSETASSTSARAANATSGTNAARASAARARARTRWTAAVTTTRVMV